MPAPLQSLRESSHSIYLLGQNPSQASHNSLKKHRQLIDALSGHGEFLFYETSPEWLSCYERDAQALHQKLPLLVYRPHQVHDIRPFLQQCYQLGLPVTARCGGTGLAGGCIASSEGVILLTGHLNRIYDYDAKKGIISIEPGVTLRQLNRFVERDGWFFPLSMQSEGVAGLSGCLSCQARGYHQQGKFLYDAIQKTICVDGHGKQLEIPSSMLCGAEGLMGVIIEMQVQLTQLPQQCMEFILNAGLETVLAQLPHLRKVQSLSFVCWCEGSLYMGLEGEAWRLPHSAAYLKRLFPDMQSIPSGSFASSKSAFSRTRSPFIVFSSSLHLPDLSEASRHARHLASELQLFVEQQIDVLSGSLQLLLHSDESHYAFTQKIEQFFVLWVDFLDKRKGVLGGCHGIGMQLAPYMIPFWNEETVRILMTLQSAFDPAGLFKRERFFPPAGRSLVRAADGE